MVSGFFSSLMCAVSFLILRHLLDDCKISLITAEGVPTSMHHFRLSAVCFQTSFTAALSLNAYCHTDTYFQCTGGLHDVAILKALQITHYNQVSCELLSFLDLNIHILATKRKKEGFFSAPMMLRMLGMWLTVSNYLKTLTLYV